MKGDIKERRAGGLLARGTHPSQARQFIVCQKLTAISFKYREKQLS